MPLVLVLPRGYQWYLSRKPLIRRDREDRLSLLVQFFALLPDLASITVIVYYTIATRLQTPTSYRNTCCTNTYVFWVFGGPCVPISSLCTVLHISRANGVLYACCIRSSHIARVRINWVRLLPILLVVS